MQLAFMGSPPFAEPVLRRILESRHRVLVIATRPSRPSGRGMKVAASPLADVARARSIPLLQPVTARDPAFVAELARLRPDVLLVASYGEILRQEMLDLAPKGALNVHASLLPRHRGASPIQAAILAGDGETGVTIQRMAARLDEGDVLLLMPTPIADRETAGELRDRLADLGGQAAVRALDLLENGKARFVPQVHARATYAPRIGKEQGTVDWSQPAEAIERHVRAMTPWPGARTTVHGKGELLLLDVRVATVPFDPRSAHPGAIVDASRAFVVAGGSGAVEIRTLKPAGKSAMGGLAWLRGARLEPGSRLGR